MTQCAISETQQMGSQTRVGCPSVGDISILAAVIGRCATVSFKGAPLPPNLCLAVDSADAVPIRPALAVLRQLQSERMSSTGESDRALRLGLAELTLQRDTLARLHGPSEAVALDDAIAAITRKLHPFLLIEDPTSEELFTCIAKSPLKSPLVVFGEQAVAQLAHSSRNAECDRLVRTLARAFRNEEILRPRFADGPPSVALPSISVLFIANPDTLLQLFKSARFRQNRLTDCIILARPLPNCTVSDDLVEKINGWVRFRDAGKRHDLNWAPEAEAIIGTHNYPDAPENALCPLIVAKMALMLTLHEGSFEITTEVVQKALAWADAAEDARARLLSEQVDSVKAAHFERQKELLLQKIAMRGPSTYRDLSRCWSRMRRRELEPITTALIAEGRLVETDGAFALPKTVAIMSRVQH